MPLWFQLDSGNIAGTIVRTDMASELGQGSSASIRLFGTKIPAVTEVSAKDIIYDGVFGTEVMNHWIVTFDLKKYELWIKPIEP